MHPQDDPKGDRHVPGDLDQPRPDLVLTEAARSGGHGRVRRGEQTGVAACPKSPDLPPLLARPPQRRILLKTNVRHQRINIAWINSNVRRSRRQSVVIHPIVPQGVVAEAAVTGFPADCCVAGGDDIRGNACSIAAPGVQVYPDTIHVDGIEADRRTVAVTQLDAVTDIVPDKVVANGGAAVVAAVDINAVVAAGDVIVRNQRPAAALDIDAVVLAVPDHAAGDRGGRIRKKNADQIVCQNRIANRGMSRAAPHAPRGILDQRMIDDAHIHARIIKVNPCPDPPGGGRGCRSEGDRVLGRAEGIEPAINVQTGAVGKPQDSPPLYRESSTRRHGNITRDYERPGPDFIRGETAGGCRGEAAALGEPP